MGVVPQLDNLDVDVTVEDNLAVFARLYRVKDVRAAVDRGPGAGAAGGPAPRRRSTSSRAACAGGCCWLAGSLHDPPLLLLDEPTVGLDPQIRTELWSLIDSLRTSGTTILMSTHYIEEAERLADEVALMAHGKIISRGKPSELVAAARGARDGRGVRAAGAAGRGARQRPRRRA